MDTTNPKKVKLMTIQNYAMINGITVQTVYNWIKEKKVVTRKIGSLTMIVVL